MGSAKINRLYNEVHTMEVTMSAKQSPKSSTIMCKLSQSSFLNGIISAPWYFNYYKILFIHFNRHTCQDCTQLFLSGELNDACGFMGKVYLCNTCIYPQNRISLELKLVLEVYLFQTWQWTYCRKQWLSYTIMKGIIVLNLILHIWNFNRTSIKFINSSSFSFIRS